MAVERCVRCDSFIDLDWHVDEIFYKMDHPYLDIGELEAVCEGCLTEEEQEKLEENEK